MTVFPGAQLTPEQLGNQIAGLSSRLLDAARDYLWADRLTRRLKESTTRIAARLHGYQDDYIPHCAQISEGVQVGCSCGRVGLCAHAVALCLDFSRHPDGYVPVPWSIRRRQDTLWPWMVEASFPWPAVPETAPRWQLPYQSPDNFLPDLLRAGWDKSRRQDSRLFLVLADLHPSWTRTPEFSAVFGPWLARECLTPGPIEDWIRLAHENPYLPLRPMWTASVLGSTAALHHALSWLFRPGPRADAETLRRHHLLYIVTLALKDFSASHWLWDSYRALDPYYLLEGEALVAAGCRQDALSLWERHLPEDAAARHAVRQHLIAIADPSAQLAHRVADCWETRSEQALADLREDLPEPQWRQLAAAIRSQSPKSPSDDR